MAEAPWPVLWELLEQVAKPAADHASRGAAREQAAQSSLEKVTETAAARAGIYVAGRWRRSCTGLAATEMFDRLVGEQCKDRHGHRRHPAAALRTGIARAARALLHSVEYIE